MTQPDIQKLFEEACQLSGDALEAFLARQTPEVAAELRELLQNDEPGMLATEQSPKNQFFRTRSQAGSGPGQGPGAEAGRQVGDFRLVNFIAQGGMGQIWEAEQVSLKRRVALKLVLPERVDESSLTLFSREARAGGRLQHTNIVATYAHGENDGQAWIAQELIEGSCTLKDFLDDLRAQDRVPDDYYRSVAELVAKLADALGAAHQAGVIHRDIKPQNILIAADDEPKLTDFGLARITDETALSRTGDFAGTYFYMSPEQVTAKRMGIDHSTDIFSLGVVLYEMLTLRRPFEGDTAHQICEKIVTWDPPDPRRVRSQCPRELAVICGKALEKARRDRYANMQAFAADLRRHTANEPILARPPGRLVKAKKYVQRNPYKALAGGVASVAFLLISGLLVLFDAKRKESDANAQEAQRQEAIAKDNAEEATEQTRIAATNLREAERQADIARKRAEDILSLSAFQRLEDLTDEAEALWPPHPEHLQAYVDWLAGAEKLVAGLLPGPAGDDVGHLARLTALRKKALPRSEADVERDRHEHPRRSELSEARAQFQALEGRMEGMLRSDALDEVDTLGEELDAQSERIEELQSEVERPWRWRFADENDRWWHNQLEKLAAAIEAFSDAKQGLVGGVSAEWGWGIQRRHDFAATLEERTLSGSEVTDKWHAARERVAANDDYRGLELVPQLGLVPLGPDPESGLEEFGHPLTGDVPERDAQEKLVLTETMGLVFVLLPGGEFSMGAQKSDPQGRNYDPQAASNEGPVHQVTLTPFFLSKYEMTQGQWLRLTADNPSGYQPPSPSLLHPVEQIDWNSSMETCKRLGLTLPTEAQWEYGARGGTTSVWWTGNERESLGTQEAANVADQTAESYSNWPVLFEAWNDGYLVHASVGRFAPNAFGLYNVHGNVWEWCLDGYGRYRRGTAVDPLSDPSGSPRRGNRGGSFGNTAVYARSALRFFNLPVTADDDLGLRPARALLAP